MYSTTGAKVTRQRPPSDSEELTTANMLDATSPRSSMPGLCRSLTLFVFLVTLPSLVTPLSLTRSPQTHPRIKGGRRLATMELEVIDETKTIRRLLYDEETRVSTTLSQHIKASWVEILLCREREEQLATQKDSLKSSLIQIQEALDIFNNSMNHFSADLPELRNIALELHEAHVKNVAKVEVMRQLDKDEADTYQKLMKITGDGIAHAKAKAAINAKELGGSMEKTIEYLLSSPQSESRRRRGGSSTRIKSSSMGRRHHRSIRFAGQPSPKKQQQEEVEKEYLSSQEYDEKQEDQRKKNDDKYSKGEENIMRKRVIAWISENIDDAATANVRKQQSKWGRALLYLEKVTITKVDDT
eukprot:jgi/Bigna1/127889/aug1.5_g2597